jgi:hypothetical protein
MFEGVQMTKLNCLLVTSVALALSTHGYASMYKCPGSNGTVTFQDQPCEGLKQKDIAKSAVSKPIAASQSAVSADHRAAFREMALAWGLEESLRKEASELVATFDHPETLTYLEDGLIDGLKMDFGSEMYRLPAMRALARKYAIPLVKLARVEALDIEGLMAAFESEYTRVFSAQELREIAAYYRATGMQVGPRPRKQAQPDASSAEAAFAKSPTSAKLNSSLSPLQGNARKNHGEKPHPQISAIHEQCKGEVIAVVFKGKSPPTGR